MNAECPVCGYNWATEGMPENGPVPIEENDKIGTLHFCSKECKKEYKNA